MSRSAVVADPVLLPYGDHGHNLRVFTPPTRNARGAAAASGSTSAIVFFFGGGWRSGNPQQFEPHCRHLASRGMVCAAAEYRTNAVIRECIEDAGCAVAALRARADEFRFNPDRLVASGGSAGGHLAIALCVCPLEGPASEARPNACIGFNPNVTVCGLGRWAELTGFSPADGKGLPVYTEADCPMTALSWVEAGLDALTLPPMLILHGEEDRAPTAYSSAKGFVEKYVALGGQADLISYPNQTHGFFNKGSPVRVGHGPTPGLAPGEATTTLFSDTLADVDEWLTHHGHIEHPPATSIEIAQYFAGGAPVENVTPAVQAHHDVEKNDITAAWDNLNGGDDDLYDRVNSSMATGGSAEKAKL